MRNILKNKSILGGGIIVIMVVLIAVFAPLVAPYDPVKDADLARALEPPGGRFLLGTDPYGRDVLSRVLYGARISLMVGLIAQTMNTIIGVSLGLLSGYFGGKIDDGIMGLTNIMLSMPALILALAIMAVLGPGIINVFIALGVVNWTYSCRIARAGTLSIREKEFVDAAKSLGCSTFRIFRKHILPNILGPIIVIATLGVADAILMAATLGFLGLGAQPPTPEWGAMLSRGRDYMWSAPWLCIFPGLAIFITVLGLNLLGDGLRDVLDPHLRGRRKYI
jgi:peptide/nickel transport system permease protein